MILCKTYGSIAKIDEIEIYEIEKVRIFQKT